jgi:putative oxygen-independent coproporphyrinogen III oxidase
MNDRATSARLAEALSPDDPRLADAAHHWKSAYVHIPFCRRRCPYCDFAIVDESVVTASHDRYVDAVVAEIWMEDDFPALDAVNLGGGTPSTLGPRHLARIVDALRDRFGLVDGAEVSLEVNPEDWKPALGDRLVQAGFTRVSIGAQSFDGAILGALGRAHTADQVERTVEGARSSGFRSIGVDLIIGHPAESDASWLRTVTHVMSLAPDHVSTYALTVEPGTALAQQIRAGAPAPDDDTQADRYDVFTELSSRHGIVRYEVSNHSRAGHACRYNLATWAHGEYLGFGIAAHDHRWGRRARNHRRLDRYLDDVEGGRRPRLGAESLDVRGQERDRLMLGLRLAAGTPVTETAAAFLETPSAERFREAGILAVREGRVVVTEPMMADAVAREALSVSPRDC